MTASKDALTAAGPGIANLDGDAVTAIAGLGSRAEGFRVEWVDTPEASGLPPKVPVGIRTGAKPEPVDLRAVFEAWRLRPARKSGTAAVKTLQSFIDLVNYHATDTTAIFADSDWTKPSFLAVLDYSGPAPEDPGHHGHRVLYEFPLSEAWRVWTAGNGRPMEQAEFAAFIEDRIADLSSPTDTEVREYEQLFSTRIATPAQLMKLSRGLQVNVEATVVNATTLQTGEGQIVFDEKHKGADGQPIQVPGLFMLQVEPFFMGQLARLPVRLRYRVKSGSIVWNYQLYRPDQHVTDRVRADLVIVREEVRMPCYEGRPENPAG